MPYKLNDFLIPLLTFCFMNGQIVKGKINLIKQNIYKVCDGPCKTKS